MTRLLFLITTITLLASGCGSSGAVGEGSVSDLVSTPSTGAGTTTFSTTTEEMALQVWLTSGETLWPVTRMVPKTEGVGAAAMDAMLAGATETEASNGIGSTVPADTHLLGLSIAGGTATVDLSNEYASGGGTLSMTMRLAQVVYTLTEFPTVKRVAFKLDGEPVTVFSGEGIILDRPQTRKDYEDLAPIIAVASPAHGATVSSPVTVSGVANVFEANVTVEILDANGKLLAKDFTTATCGTGCWGDYSLDLPFEVSSRQKGTIVVHDDDAEGSGTYPHEVRIPVVLTP
jgi:immunoglobulin-like protein involved in spore germination/sporulation and spore germination protein